METESGQLSRESGRLLPDLGSLKEEETQRLVVDLLAGAIKPYRNLGEQKRRLRSEIDFMSQARADLIDAANLSNPNTVLGRERSLAAVVTALAGAGENNTIIRSTLDQAAEKLIPGQRAELTWTMYPLMEGDCYTTGPKVDAVTALKLLLKEAGPILEQRRLEKELIPDKGKIDFETNPEEWRKCEEISVVNGWKKAGEPIEGGEATIQIWEKSGKKIAVKQFSKKLGEIDPAFSFIGEIASRLALGDDGRVVKIVGIGVVNKNTGRFQPYTGAVLTSSEEAKDFFAEGMLSSNLAIAMEYVPLKSKKEFLTARYAGKMLADLCKYPYDEAARETFDVKEKSDNEAIDLATAGYLEAAADSLKLLKKMADAGYVPQDYNIGGNIAIHRSILPFGRGRVIALDLGMLVPTSAEFGKEIDSLSGTMLDKWGFSTAKGIGKETALIQRKLSGELSDFEMHNTPKVFVERQMGYYAMKKWLGAVFKSIEPEEMEKILKGMPRAAAELILELMPVIFLESEEKTTIMPSFGIEAMAERMKKVSQEIRDNLGGPRTDLSELSGWKDYVQAMKDYRSVERWRQERAEQVIAEMSTKDRELFLTEGEISVIMGKNGLPVYRDYRAAYRQNSLSQTDVGQRRLNLLISEVGAVSRLRDEKAVLHPEITGIIIREEDESGKMKFCDHHVLEDVDVYSEGDSSTSSLFYETREGKWIQLSKCDNQYSLFKALAEADKSLRERGWSITLFDPIKEKIDLDGIYYDQATGEIVVEPHKVVPLLTANLKDMESERLAGFRLGVSWNSAERAVTFQAERLNDLGEGGVAGQLAEALGENLNKNIKALVDRLKTGDLGLEKFCRLLEAGTEG